MRWDGTVVLEDSMHKGWAVVFDKRITYVGPSEAAPGMPDQVYSYIVPGLIDVHTHGGGGESFPDATTIDQVKTAAQSHLSSGTTTMLASTVSAAIPVLEERAKLLAEATDKGIVAGIHFEGPFLSEARCGAQDPRFLIPADEQSMQRLMEAAGGHARSMTIAPEFADLPSLKVLADAGAIPSWGHTDSSQQVAQEAIKNGMDVLQGRQRASVTHLFNGMRPLHHRDPGPIPAFLEAAADGEVVVEMICDGVHLDPGLVKSIVEIVGRENCVFVTDSMAAAGLGDGTYTLGPQMVRVENGTARLLHGGSIAGGTSHLADCVRIATMTGGLPLVDAVWMASTQGAKMFGWNDRGSITVGKRSDLLALDTHLQPAAVVREGLPVEVPVSQ
jgi:N-acetylglucosamine-6-phosphate deacetylase